MKALLIAAALLLSFLSNLRAQTNLSYITNVSMPNAVYSVAVSGKYVYAGGGGAPGGNPVRIFDISEPSNPVDVGYVDSLGGCTAFAVSGQNLYRVGGNGISGPVSILNLANPTNPAFVGTIDGNFYEMRASGTKVYLGGSIGVDSGLFLFDASNSASPVRLALFTNSTSRSTMVVGDYAATFYWPIEWLVFPTNISLGEIVAIPQQFGVFNDSVVSGDVVYSCGLSNTVYAYDISDPSSPAIIYQSLFNDCNGFYISGNYLYAVGASGFSMWDISTPFGPVFINGPLIRNFGIALAVSKGYAYVADIYGLSIYSLGNPPPPPLSIASASGELKCSWPTPNPAFAVQQNPDLNSSNWTTLTNVPVVVGINNQVTVPKQEQRMFYRLISQ